MKLTTVALALTTALSAQAFERSSPLLAWSSHDLEAISQLAAGPVAAAKHVFASAAAAAQVPLQRGGSGESSDLCTLSTVLLVSVPGLHASDLALLPSTHASPTGLRASLSAAAQKVQQLYLSASQIKRATLVRGVAKSFVNECGAVVQGGEEKSLWGGEAGKTMLFDRVDGMDELELTGAEARAARREVMLNVDQILAQHATNLPAPWLIILTALPSSAVSVSELHKRGMEDVETEIFGKTLKKPVEVPGLVNIFEPKKNSGLLFRYVFFTPPLIFSLLLTVLILIPVLVLSTSALTSIETVAGLESKMKGSVGIDPAKA